MESLAEIHSGSENGKLVSPINSMLSVREGQADSHSQEDLTDEHNLGDENGHNYEILHEWPDRNDYDPEAWGHVHEVPEPGTADRAHIFAKPYPMSDNEKDQILSNYRKALLSHGNGIGGDCSLLGDHVRAGETPSQRADKEVKALEALGIEATVEVRNNIVDRNQESLGLRSTLATYLQGQTHCEIKYVNEIFRQLDRLQLETATQLSHQEIVHENELGSKNAEIHQLERAAKESQRKIDKLQTAAFQQEADKQAQLMELQHKDTKIALLEQQLAVSRQQESTQLSSATEQAKELTARLDNLFIDYEAMNEEARERKLAFDEVVMARDEARDECQDLSERLRMTENTYAFAMARVRETEERVSEHLAEGEKVAKELEDAQGRVRTLEERLDVFGVHFRQLRALLYEQKGL
jgi:chromosome segregation ATPase